MIRVDFYVHQKVGFEPLALTACRLAEKAFMSAQRVYIHTDSEDAARLLDERLWTFHDRSFVPHCMAGASSDVPVVIGHGQVPVDAFDFLINIAAQVPDLDAVYIAIGWGSGACGLSAARNALGLKTKIIGVVSAQAPSYARSIEQGKIVEIPPQTRIGDGVAIAYPHPGAFEMVRDQIERIVEVDDEAIEEAMRIYFRCTHNVAEGAGAASLAAVLQERETVNGKKVAAILTGGNVDTEIYARVLAARSVG